MIIDPISDMLTRIRNAGKSQHLETRIPGSKVKTALAEVLMQSGFIKDFRVEGELKKTLVVGIKYQGRTPVIEGLKRISLPSCRMYVNNREIPRVMGGLGVAILSTSKGLMTDRAAREQHLGGEVLCYVW